MANKNIDGDVNVQFTEASSRQSLETGESVKTLFGKLRKWLSDLKPVAFSGSYNDLSNKPTIPTKSSLGLGNVDNTSDVNKPVSTAQQTALNGKVSKAGDTMTGELKTSFKCVANGSIEMRTETTLSDFIEYVRYSSGCTGSVMLSTYTFNDITISAGWYNFEWISHRTDGKNGAANGDNCNYGTLILTGMTVANAGYVVKYTGQAITEVHELYKGEELTQKALLKEDDNAGGYDIILDKPFRLGYGFYSISITRNGITLDQGGDIVSIKSDGIYFNGEKIGS